MSVSAPRPVAPGDVVTLGPVERLAYGGQGVTRIGDTGFVVLCRGALPGDVVTARIGKVRRRMAEARAIDVVTPGADRVEAPCPHARDRSCGGCALQALAYPAQLAAKADQVVDALRRLGGLDGFDVGGPVASPPHERFGYRNKVEFSFAPPSPAGGGGPVGLGYHRAGRWDELIDLEVCLLVSPAVEAIRRAVRGWAREHDLSARDPRREREGDPPSGLLRHCVVREARGGRADAEQLVHLITSPPDAADPEAPLPHADALVAAVHAAAPSVATVTWSVNPGSAEVASGFPVTVLHGPGHITETLGGLDFALSPNAFFQTNTRQAERLYAVALAEARLAGGERVFDLYSGVGSIGLYLLRHGGAGRVVGAEVVAAAVDDARRSAAANGLADRIRYEAGDVKHLLRTLTAEEGRPDVLVVDPPRAGCQARVVRRIVEVGAPVVVYVSCNPTTLAADAAGLLAGGYRAERVTAVDMFPQTPHVEAVARFVRDA